MYVKPQTRLQEYRLGSARTRDSALVVGKLPTHAQVDITMRILKRNGTSSRLYSIEVVTSPFEACAWDLTLSESEEVSLSYFIGSDQISRDALCENMNGFI